MVHFKKLNNNILTFLVLILFISSCKKNKNIKLMQTEIISISNKFQINLDIVLENKKDDLKIELSFKKPYRLIDEGHQDMFLSYLIYKLKNRFREYNTVEFIYYIDSEKYFNTRMKIYNANEIQTIYNKGNILKLIEFCLKEFKAVDPILLNEGISFYNKKFPNDTVNIQFFVLLKNFDNNNNLKEMNTFLIIYFFNKQYLNNDKIDNDRKKQNYLISRIWEISKGNNIDLKEDTFFDIFAAANGLKRKESQ